MSDLQQQKKIPRMLRALWPPSKRLSVGSRSDWLTGLIDVAKAATAAGELAPFPFVGTAAGSVVLLLQAVERVQKNKDDVKSLLESIVNLVVVIRDDVLSQGDQCATTYAAFCKVFAEDLVAIADEVNACNRANKDFSSQFLKSSSIRAKIESHQARLQELRANFTLSTVVQTHFAVNALRENMSQMAANTLPTHRDVPYKPMPTASRRFTGRESYLSKLRQYFGPQTETSSQRKEFLLYGMGGAGKTQICLKFAEISSDLFSQIFWVDATSTDTISSSLQAIAATPHAQAAAVEQSTNSVLHWLSCAKHAWLLIFDNVDCKPGIVMQYLPSGTHGNMLFTSRDPAMQSLVSVGASADVDCMEEEDAMSLLLTAAFLDSSSDELRQASKPIVSELCYLPLAVDQAGTLIGKGLCGLHDYLKMYARHHKKLMAHPSFEGASMYGRAVYATWDALYVQIETKTEAVDSDEAQAAKSAIFLLQLFAFFHHESITEEMFKRAAEAKKPTYSKDTGSHRQLPSIASNCPSDLLKLDEEGQWDPLFFREGIRELYSYSLVKAAGACNGYRVHPLVHLWSHDRMSAADHGNMCNFANALLTHSIRFGYNAEDYAFRTIVIPHIKTCISRGSKAPVMQRYNYFQSAYYGLVLYEGGHLRDAEEILVKALEAVQGPLEAEHPDMISCMANLATTIQKQGRWKEAEKLQVQVLGARKKLLGAEHPLTWKTMESLSLTIRDQGRWKEAEDLQSQVLEMKKQLYGPKHAFTLKGMARLAEIMCRQGRWKEAEELQTQILAGRTQILGPEHPDTLSSGAALAATRSHQGRWAEAKELLVQVLEIRRVRLGEDHLVTWSSTASLAETLSYQGMWKEAEELQVHILERRKKLFGPEHPDTLSSMAALAATNRDQGRWAEAEQLETKVLETRKQLFGPEHPETLQAMVNLSKTWRLQGLTAKAWVLMLHAGALQTKVLGQDHPDTVCSSHILSEWQV